jgi:cell division topological specificity factor
MLNGFFQKMFAKSGSKDVAKKRLKFALVYDKLEVSDTILEQLQEEIVAVISRYFEIDKKALTLDIERSDEMSALVVNTPILSAKKRHQIA